MSAPLPDHVEPYTGISPKAYEHPADRAATAALNAIPMLPGLVRRLVEWRYERAMRQYFLGTSVQVSERQLPELYASHLAAARILDVPAPDLYVSTAVPGSALTIGAQHPMIVLDSLLLGRLGQGERRVVVGHELGHILSNHVTYTTALGILISAGNSLPLLLDLPFRAVQTVLLEWSRVAELTCDRAATLIVRDPQIVCRTLMVTAAGLPADQLNLDAFMAQALEYETWDAPTDHVRRFFTDLAHPPADGAARLGGHALGPERRVRPHPPRRVPPPGRRHRRARRGGRRGRLLRRPLPGRVPRHRDEPHQSR